MTKGQQEMGSWSATITVPAGGPQTQAAGAFSFATPLDEKQSTNLKVRYMNEEEVLAPESHPGCIGNAQEPYAEEGWLCIYQGATAEFGSLMTEWKEAGFFAVDNGAGEGCKPAVKEGTGVLRCRGVVAHFIENFQLGGFVVFRTKTFNEPPLSRTTIPAAAELTAMGTWAVRAIE